MTLLVGILARDGVVIAADRAVTFAAGRQHTVADSHRKLTVIPGGVIIAGTGEVGLGQRFREIVKQKWDAKEFTRPQGAATGAPRRSAPEVGTMLTQSAVQNFNSTGVHAGTPPNGISFGALMAYALETPELIEFSGNAFQPEHKTNECWYASMGSGQPIADPYLALMRRSVWKDGQPAIEDATFVAHWVMQQAIAAAPGFIAEPIDIAVIKKWNGKNFEAKLLEENQLELHRNRAQEANAQLRQALLGQLANSTIPPEMPQP